MPNFHIYVMGHIDFQKNMCEWHGHNSINCNFYILCNFYLFCIQNLLSNPLTLFTFSWLVQRSNFNRKKTKQMLFSFKSHSSILCLSFPNAPRLISPSRYAKETKRKGRICFTNA